MSTPETEGLTDFNRTAQEYAPRPRLHLPKPASGFWQGLSLFLFCVLYILLGILLASMIGGAVMSTGYDWRLDTVAGRLLLIPAIILHQVVILRVLAPVLRPIFRREEIAAMHHACFAPAGEAFVFVPSVFRGQLHSQADVRIEDQAIVVARRGGLLEGTLVVIPALLAFLANITERNLRVLVPAALVALLAMVWLWRESRHPVVRTYRVSDIRRIEIDHNLYRFKVRSPRLRLPTTYVFAMAPELQPEFDAALEDAFLDRIHRVATSAR